MIIETQPPPFNEDSCQYYNIYAHCIFAELDIASHVTLYDEIGFTAEALEMYGEEILGMLHGYVRQAFAYLGLSADMVNALALERDMIVRAVKRSKGFDSEGVEELSVEQPLFELKPEKDHPIKPENRSEGSDINGQSGTIFMPERKKKRAVRRSSGEHWSAPPKRKKTPRGNGKAQKKRHDPWTTYANVSGSIFSSAAMRSATDTS